MFRMIEIELKRFKKSFILVLGIYLFLFLFFKPNNETIILVEYIAIHALTTGVSIWITTSYILDENSNNRYLYLKSKFSNTQIFISKLLTIFIFSFITILLSTLLFNIKALIYKNNHSLEFFMLNLDNIGLLFINKSPLEFFYPINYLLNNIYLVIMIFTANFYYRKHIGKVKYKKAYVLFMMILFNVFIENYIVYAILFLLNKELGFLNFNYLSSRVRAIPLHNFEINFLSIISIVVYVFISYYFVKMIIKEKDDELL